jgi:hypothetical protein
LLDPADEKRSVVSEDDGRIEEFGWATVRHTATSWREDRQPAVH